MLTANHSPHSSPNRWLGADHVFIIENASETYRALQPGLQDLIDAGFVTYHWDGYPYGQRRAYKWCFEQHRADYNWMAFFDVDEYLVIREKCAAAAARGCGR